MQSTVMKDGPAAAPALEARQRRLFIP